MRNPVFLTLMLVTAACPVIGQGTAPVLAGIRLGDATDVVRQRLGNPDRTQESLGLRFWDYQRRGVTVIWRNGERGVHGVVLTKPDAGDAGGVKIGDSDLALHSVWGAPARTRQNGRFADYVGSGWVLSVELQGGRIARTTLMRASPAPDSAATKPSHPNPTRRNHQ